MKFRDCTSMKSARNIKGYRFGLSKTALEIEKCNDYQFRRLILEFPALEKIIVSQA